MNLAIDDFELFGLPRRFALDRGELDARRRALQAEVHPDRFAGADAAARRAAMQWAVRVNEAYAAARGSAQARRLPVRARRERRSAPKTTPRCRPTSCAADGLARVARRRRLARARSTPSRTTSRTRDALAYERLASALDERRDFAAAAQEVRALMFIERFAADVDDRLVALERLTRWRCCRSRNPASRPTRTRDAIAVGIDLGTTHSLVAAVRNGVAECLPDRDGEVILPSAVRYLADGTAPDRPRGARRRGRAIRPTPSSRSSA